MENPLQNTPFDNVFYYTWLVDFSFLDGNGKDLYNPEADYVTNQTANNERFLQKDIFTFWGSYSTKDMRVLLDLYVYKKNRQSGSEHMGSYFTEWLNHTISISKSKLPELSQWCECFNIDSGIETFNPPKFVSIRMIDTNGNEFTQHISIDEHFGIANEVKAFHSLQKSDESTPDHIAKRVIKSSTLETHLTTDQVVQLLGKNKSTLWRWGKEKYLVPVKVGRSNLYKREDVQAILDGKPRY